ncbi:alpha/beta fold hydrolase [Nocardia vaccinii]|uniref:alpha/beta fold hydrolase n=1 Tax=Nocardia vaccinii TaxID=1822 RepID=UPI0012F49C6C|nr:alpha/beta fold hydrolase [Nocardia vaccinii]
MTAERTHQSTLGPLLAVAVEKLVGGPCYLLGTPMGGVHALYVGSLLPERVLGVVLEGSMAPALPGEDLYPCAGGNPPTVDTRYRTRALVRPWATAEFVGQQMANRTRMFGFFDMEAADAIETIADHEIPVLALLGADDEILRPTQEQRIRERIPHAEFHLVEGGAHDL